MSPWHHILTADEIAARHAFTAKLDPAFARGERKFYKACTKAQLEVLAAQAWSSNSSDAYQLARSYAALRRAA